MVAICSSGKSWKMPIYPIPPSWGYCAPQKSDTALVGLIRVSKLHENWQTGQAYIDNDLV